MTSPRMSITSRICVGPQPRERVVQDGRRPRRVERRLLDLVHRGRLLEVRVGAPAPRRNCSGLPSPAGPAPDIGFF